MSRVKNMNDSCHTYEQIESDVRRTQTTTFGDACRMYMRKACHTFMHELHVTYVNVNERIARHIHVHEQIARHMHVHDPSARHVYDMCHVTRMNECMNESSHP